MVQAVGTYDTWDLSFDPTTSQLLEGQDRQGTYLDRATTTSSSTVDRLPALKVCPAPTHRPG